MQFYPIKFNLDEIDRLTSQSTNLCDDILPLLGAQANSCLEIGCGVGSNVPLITQNNQHLNFMGIDISTHSIDHARNKYSANQPNIKFQVNEGSDLPFENDTFDLVVIRLVLWAAPNRLDILNEAHRVLKPNGIIYCFEPDDQFLFNYPPKSNFNNIVSLWQSKVQATGSDPFVGRKINHYFTAVGFETLNMQIKLSHYDSTDPIKYLTAIGNLWRIFSSQGPEFFGTSSEAEEWKLALQEIKSCTEGAVLTEGYFIGIGRKRGVAL